MNVVVACMHCVCRGAFILYTPFLVLMLCSACPEYLQIVQKIPGRVTADDPGDGHHDKVIGISCHPDKKLIASGSLSGDTFVRIWQDTH